MLGGKGGSHACLLTLTERKSRREVIRELPDKTQASAFHELDVLERQLGRKEFNQSIRRLRQSIGQSF